MVKLFLDDVRDPDFDPCRWVVVRTFYEAVNLVTRLGLPEISLISFDHDLGMMGGSEKTGMDFARWIVDTELDGSRGRLPKTFSFRVHSMNPVGAKNIRNLLKVYFLTCNQPDETGRGREIPPPYRLDRLM